MKTSLPRHSWLPQGCGGAPTLCPHGTHTAQTSLTSHPSKIFYQAKPDNSILGVMRLSSPARGSPSWRREDRSFVWWLTEWMPVLYNVYLYVRDLRECSCTEAFARVSKKGTHVILPAHGAPNSPLRTFYETISEGNRTVVSQTDSTSIFPQRLKKQKTTKKKAKQDKLFIKSKSPSCTSVPRAGKSCGSAGVEE